MEGEHDISTVPKARKLEPERLMNQNDQEHIYGETIQKTMNSCELVLDEIRLDIVWKCVGKVCGELDAS